MLINRDPDGGPELTAAMCRRADELRMHPVHVVLDEKDSELGDPATSFYALVPFLPRRGDRIQVDNGAHCEVQRAYFKLTKLTDAQGRTEALGLMPNVHAILLEEV